ncbi:hypothetical protein L207DRAFT_614139 [Hyaloscypha variabilis F]|uniref:Uncharacterized protein n=1 Tax=Hyaloscypha variabilis (strain UAMH 11265 / GT02V1 / F) TaxID=1149755 RepID=A0A2J6QWP8_HYAVF|nr:hypothetical protein L207DRAFT_614139 [Hyaloscypha variabilis F]
MASKASKIALPEIPETFDTGFIGDSLDIYLWTLTLDETKVVLSGLRKYFTSEIIDERLKGWFLEDVMGWIEGAEEYMEEWGKHSQKAESGDENGGGVGEDEQQEDAKDSGDNEDSEDFDPSHIAQGKLVSMLMDCFSNHNAEEYRAVLKNLMAVVNVRGKQREKIPKWKALHLLGKWFKDLLDGKNDDAQPPAPVS